MPRPTHEQSIPLFDSDSSFPRLLPLAPPRLLCMFLCVISHDRSAPLTPPSTQRPCGCLRRGRSGGRTALWRDSCGDGGIFEEAASCVLSSVEQPVSRPDGGRGASFHHPTKHSISIAMIASSSLRASQHRRAAGQRVCITVAVECHRSVVEKRITSEGAPTALKNR